MTHLHRLPGRELFDVLDGRQKTIMLPSVPGVAYSIGDELHVAPIGARLEEYVVFVITEIHENGIFRSATVKRPAVSPTRLLREGGI